MEGGGRWDVRWGEGGGGRGKCSQGKKKTRLL